MQEAILNAPVVAGVTLPRPWLTWVGRLSGGAIGAVLLVATLAKAVDPQSFAELLQEKGLTLGLPPLVAAVLALALEGGLGLLLLLGVRRKWSLLATALVVLFFVAMNGWEWWRAAHGELPAAGCGCFGNLLLRSPAAAFWQDLLLVPLLLLAGLGLAPRAAALPRRRLAAVMLGTAAVALLAWRAPGLPLDDLATRLRPGVELARVCAGAEAPVCLTDVVPDIATGRAWVVLVDLEDAPRWAEALNRFASREGRPPVVALTAAPREQLIAFTWQWGPTFSLREAPAAVIRPLYRRLPRSFLSEDGRVLRTVSGLPTGEGESPR